MRNFILFIYGRRFACAVTAYTRTPVYTRTSEQGDAARCDRVGVDDAGAELRGRVRSTDQMELKSIER